jgi:hypothetical protein
MKKEEIEQKIETLEGNVRHYEDVNKLYKQSKKELKQLKQQLKDLPSLEVGKWYKFKHCLFNYQENANVYGFFRDDWRDASWSWTENDYRPTQATDKEVEEALIKEAKRRGFKEGVNIKGLSCYSGVMSGNNVLVNTKDYYFRSGQLFVNRNEESNMVIFDNGKWATIIKPKTVNLNGDYTEVQLKDVLNSQF